MEKNSIESETKTFYSEGDSGISGQVITAGRRSTIAFRSANSKIQGHLTSRCQSGKISEERITILVFTATDRKPTRYRPRRTAMDRMTARQSPRCLEACKNGGSSKREARPGGNKRQDNHSKVSLRYVMDYDTGGMILEAAT